MYIGVSKMANINKGIVVVFNLSEVVTVFNYILLLF